MAAARIALACVVLACLWGCASSHDDNAPLGGQTGSLVPRCVPYRLGSVPSGDGVFVAHTSDCVGEQLPDDLRLADASGNVIELTPVELGSGSVLFRAGQALDPGRYTVSGTGSSFERELVVTEAEPLPLALGSLRFVAGSGCNPTFTLELDPEVMPYKALLKLSVTVDGGAPYDWVRFGELADEPETPTLIAPCPGVCLQRGPHRLVLSAEVAGEALALEPLTLDIDVTCSGSGSEAETVSCALPASGDTRAAPVAWLFALAFAHRARARARRR